MNTGPTSDFVSRERIWKVLFTATSVIGSLLAQKLLRAGYEIVRNDANAPSPFDPADIDFSWRDVFLWAVAAGIGLGLAKVISARVAVIGWEVVTGEHPPGVAEVVPAG